MTYVVSTTILGTLLHALGNCVSPVFVAYSLAGILSILDCCGLYWCVSHEWFLQVTGVCVETLPSIWRTGSLQRLQEDTRKGSASGTVGCRCAFHIEYEGTGNTICMWDREPKRNWKRIANHNRFPSLYSPRVHQRVRGIYDLMHLLWSLSGFLLTKINVFKKLIADLLMLFHHILIAHLSTRHCAP